MNGPREGIREMTLKLPVKVADNLDAIAPLLGMSRHGLVLLLIEEGHDALLGTQELRPMLAAAKEHREQADLIVADVTARFAARVGDLLDKRRQRLERVSGPVASEIAAGGTSGVSGLVDTEPRITLEYTSKVEPIVARMRQLAGAGDFVGAARLLDDLKPAGEGNLWYAALHQIHGESGGPDLERQIRQARSTLPNVRYGTERGNGGNTEVTPSRGDAPA